MKALNVRRAIDPIAIAILNVARRVLPIRTRGSAHPQHKYENEAKLANMAPAPPIPP